MPMRTVGADMNELNRRALRAKDIYRIARVETFVEVRIVYNQNFTFV
jgi:hypothetical protein